MPAQSPADLTSAPEEIRPLTEAELKDVNGGFNGTITVGVGLVRKESVEPRGGFNGTITVSTG